MTKKIIVTYISNSRDIKGVLLLNYNLIKLKSSYSLGCIITEEVSSRIKALLKKFNIQIFSVSMKDILSKYNISDQHKKLIINKHLFGKFCVFNLINYDTVLYLDTDILLLHNIDHLLEKKVTKKKIWMVADTQATADYKSIIIVKDRFNSGVIILRPAEDMCKECFQLLCDEGSDLFNKDLFLSDQYIFEKLYNQNKLDISCLELCYNVHPILVESITKYKLMKKIYILHYMVKPKPWTLYDLEVDHIFENTTCKDLFKLWLDLYNEMLETTYFKQNKTTNISGYKRGYYDNNKLVVYNKLITKLD